MGLFFQSLLTNSVNKIPNEKKRARHVGFNKVFTEKFMKFWSKRVQNRTRHCETPESFISMELKAQVFSATALDELTMTVQGGSQYVPFGQYVMRRGALESNTECADRSIRVEFRIRSDMCPPCDQLSPKPNA